MYLALFDVDGTLVDSAGMISASLAAAFAAEGMVPPPPAIARRVVGLSLVEAMKFLTPEAGAATHQRLADAYRTAFWEFRRSGAHPEPLFEGARELLEALRRRGDVVLGIATGKSRRGVDHLLDMQHMTGWFATVQTADDHPSKPHPGMVLAALAETAIAPRNTVMIGDTSFDMEMAVRAGVRPVGVAWGNHDRDTLAKTGAEKIANNTSELADILEQFWQEAAA
jgi:phosphoglycolate phosphatase